MSWIADVVLANVAVQPVAEVQKAVVERQQNVRHHPINFRCDPTFDFLRRHIDDLLARELLVGRILLEKAEDVRVDASTDKALAPLGVVGEANLQRSDSWNRR